MFEKNCSRSDIDRTILLSLPYQALYLVKKVQHTSVAKAVTLSSCTVHRLVWCRNWLWRLGHQALGLCCGVWVFHHNPGFVPGKLCFFTGPGSGLGKMKNIGAGVSIFLTPGPGRV